SEGRIAQPEGGTRSGRRNTATGARFGGEIASSSVCSPNDPSWPRAERLAWERPVLFLLDGRKTRVPSVEGSTVRIVLRWLSVFLLLVAAGCTSSGSRNPSPPSNNINNQPFWLQPKDRNSPTLNQPNLGSRDTNSDTRLTSAEQKEWSGVLAGVLVDSFNQKISPAYIQVEALSSDGQGRPLDVAVDSHGYLVIPGLQAGNPSLLTARAELEGRPLAGRVQAVPPQPRLMIKLKEDLASASVPPLPGNNSAVVPAGGLPNRPPLPA